MPQHRSTGILAVRNQGILSVTAQVKECSGHQEPGYIEYYSGLKSALAVGSQGIAQTTISVEIYSIALGKVSSK